MKTIEEAANDYAMCYLNCKTECDTFETCDEKQTCCNRLERNAHIAGVKFAETWIPVDEELPEEDSYVLSIEDGHYGKEDQNNWVVMSVFWKGNFANAGNVKISHWRPINHK